MEYAEFKKFVDEAVVGGLDVEAMSSAAWALDLAMLVQEASDGYEDIDRAEALEPHAQRWLEEHDSDHSIERMEQANE